MYSEAVDHDERRFANYKATVSCFISLRAYTDGMDWSQGLEPPTSKPSIMRYPYDTISAIFPITVNDNLRRVRRVPRVIGTFINSGLDKSTTTPPFVRWET